MPKAKLNKQEKKLTGKLKNGKTFAKENKLI